MFAAATPCPAQDPARPSGSFTSVIRDSLSPTLTRSRHNPHERKTAPFVSSNLRTLFHSQNLQPYIFHTLAHSFVHRKNITIPFPVTSALFVRSLSQERRLTHLFSCACALFREKWGCREKFGLLLDCQFYGLSTIITIFRLVSKRAARRLSRKGYSDALAALRSEALCYAFRLDELSAAPSEVPCQS
jgi:hypothetical protein